MFAAQTLHECAGDAGAAESDAGNVYGEVTLFAGPATATSRTNHTNEGTYESLTSGASLATGTDSSMLTSPRPASVYNGFGSEQTSEQMGTDSSA